MTYKYIKVKIIVVDEEKGTKYQNFNAFPAGTTLETSKVVDEMINKLRREIIEMMVKN